MRVDTISKKEPRGNKRFRLRPYTYCKTESLIQSLEALN